MRKNVYYWMFAFLLLSATSVKSQVTIGSQSDPHAGAVLDLQSTGKGLLLPNVSLTNVNTLTVVPSPSAVQKLTATGMIVYNTNGSVTGGNGVGIYVWDGSQWKSSGSSEPAPVAVSSVSVSPTTATLTTLSQTQQLTATVSPSNATNKNVTWSSSNTSIATVSSTGVVTPVANGSAIITVTTADGGKTATSLITVNLPVAVSSVSVSPTSVNFTILSDTRQLTATVSPSDAANKTVTWSSSNTSVATVSSTGLVTAKGNGAATITVTTVDGAKTATSTISCSLGTIVDGYQLSDNVYNTTYRAVFYSGSLNPCASGWRPANTQAEAQAIAKSSGVSAKQTWTGAGQQQIAGSYVSDCGGTTSCHWACNTVTSSGTTSYLQYATYAGANKNMYDVCEFYFNYLDVSTRCVKQ